MNENKITELIYQLCTHQLQSIDDLFYLMKNKSTLKKHDKRKRINIDELNKICDNVELVKRDIEQINRNESDRIEMECFNPQLQVLLEGFYQIREMYHQIASSRYLVDQEGKLIREQ